MILRALWLRPTRRRPLRALATALGVAVGVASVVSTLLSTRAAVASLSRDVEAISGRARLEVARPGGVPVEDLVHLRPLCGEVLVAPVVEGTALAPTLGGGERVRVLGIDPLVDGEVRALDLDAADDEGRAQLSAGDGVALSAGLAAQLGVAPGAPLPLVVRGARAELPVAAVFRPAQLDAAWDRVVLVDVARAQELFGRIGRFDRLELRPRLDTDLDALAERVRAALPAGYRVARPESRREEGEALVRSLDFNLTALAGVSLIVGAVLVATTLATSVVQRREAIALLRSLGASRAQVASAVLFEAAAVGLAGGALGVVLGTLGARASLGAVSATVATVAEEAVAGALRLRPELAVAGVLLGLVTALAAAWMPLAEALRTPPLQGLRQQHAAGGGRRALARRGALFVALVALACLLAALPAWRGRPVGALLAALVALACLIVAAEPLVAGLARLRAPRAASLSVAQAALQEGRQRAAWAAGAVGVAVALAVSMGAMVTSFRTAVVDWTTQTMRSDLHVHPRPPEGGVAAGVLLPEVVDVARARFGDDAVDVYSSAQARLDGEPVDLAGGSFAVLARHGGVPFLDGRPSREVFGEALATGGVVVNEPFARRFRVRRGDRVTFETAAGPSTHAVAGVYRDYSGHRGRAVVDRATFLRLFPDEGPRSLSIFLPAGASPEAARAALAADLGDAFAGQILLNAEMRRQVLAVFDRTFAVTVALRVVASVVAGLAVVLVLSALVRERRRELAVLRVLGGSRGQTVASVMGEALLLGLAGAAGGAVVGLAVGWILVAVVNVQSFGWSMPFALTWGGLLVTAGAVLPACLVAGLLPAAWALRVPPREALADA